MAALRKRCRNMRMNYLCSSILQIEYQLKRKKGRKIVIVYMKEDSFAVAGTPEPRTMW